MRRALIRACCWILFWTTLSYAAVTKFDLTKQVKGILAVVNGGTGTASTLVGLVRGSASAMTAAELSGDATTSGSNAVVLAAKYKVLTCEIVVGDPGAASPVLANDNDTPRVCYNATGATLTISSVICYSDAGSPTVTPIITGGSSTSILSSALTCNQTGAGASGSLNGTPTLASTETIDGNITTAGGTAKYIVLRINMTL